MRLPCGLRCGPVDLPDAPTFCRPSRAVAAFARDGCQVGLGLRPLLLRRDGNPALYASLIRLSALGVVRRQGIQNTVIAYLGVGVGFLNNIFLFTHFLTKSELGLTRLLIQIAVLLALPAGLGFPNVAARYFPRFRDPADQHGGFLWFLLTVPLAAFTAAAAAFYLLKPVVLSFYAGHSELLPRYFDWIGVLALSTLVYQLFDAYLRSLYKTVASSLIQDVLLRVGTAACVGVYALGWVGFDVFVALFVVVNSLAGVGMMLYAAWLKQLFVWPDWRVFHLRRELLPMVRYGLYSVLGNVSNTVIASIDSLLILRFGTDAQVGVYTTAFFVTSVLLVPGRSLYKIALPQVADFWNEGRMDKLADLYRRVSLLNLTASGYLFVGLWVNVDNLFRLLPPGYEKGKLVILLLGLGRLFDQVTGINGTILFTSPRYRWDLAFNVSLALLTAVSCWFFIPRYGIVGAAFASAFTLVAVNVGRLIAVWVWFDMQPFTRRTLIVAAIGLASYAAGWALPALPAVPGKPWLDILVRGGVVTIVYAGLLLGTRAVPDVGALVGLVKARTLGRRRK